MKEFFLYLKRNLEPTPYEKRVILFLLSIFIIGDIALFVKKNFLKNKAETSETEIQKNLQFDEKNFIININTAKFHELIRIPGIGQVIAMNIIKHRKTKKFEKVEDLLNVKGIGPKKLEKIRPYIEIK